jgi:hypothetical protein
MSAGSSRAPRAHIRSLGMSCGRCGGCNASRSPSHPSCSPRSAGRPLRRQGSPAWLSVQGPRRSLGSRSTRTCSGMPVATRWQTKGTTREPCRLTSGTATSSIRFATLSSRRRASRTFGANETTWRLSFRRLTGIPSTTARTLDRPSVRLFEVDSPKQVDDGRNPLRLFDEQSRQGRYHLPLSHT